MTEAKPASSPLNHIPGDVFCAQDYEFLARQFIAGPTYAYIAGGSAQDVTLAANRAAFDNSFIVPRLLRDLRGGHTRCQLLGETWRHPLLLAPVAYQTLVHPQGELASAQAAAATDSCLVASTLSSVTLEEIAARAGPARWFQLYFQPQRAATLDLVRRAEAAGYRALIVTLDTAIKMPSLGAQRAGFTMPAEVFAGNLRDYPAPPQRTLAPGQSIIFQGAMSEAPGWADLAWLLDQTRLPVLVKGVLNSRDARQLQAMGIAGVVVSNHGGRSLDGAPASLAMLPAIRAAVGGDFPVLFDSGIRSGRDVFKALALGADAVMIGRLQVYALAVAGALGVAHLLKLLREELEVCMAQAGCATLADIGPEMIFRQKDEARRC